MLGATPRTCCTGIQRFEVGKHPGTGKLSRDSLRGHTLTEVLLNPRHNKQLFSVAENKSE